MNNDLNKATRRLLQVVLDMLSDAPAVADYEKEEKKSRYEPLRFRTDINRVEAAWRAAREAQEMLAEAEPFTWPAGSGVNGPFAPKDVDRVGDSSVHPPIYGNTTTCDQSPQ